MQSYGAGDASYCPLVEWFNGTPPPRRARLPASRLPRHARLPASRVPPHVTRAPPRAAVFDTKKPYVGFPAS
eukprot:5198315-Prymnesium_polylepis.1